MSIGVIKDVWAKEKSFKVLRVRETGRILIGVDRFDGVRRVKGPLLSEEDLMQLLGLMSEHSRTEVLSSLPGTKERDLEVSSEEQSTSTHINISAEDEIALAIAEARKAPGKKAPVITVLPTLPEFRYVHTCPHCDSHVARQLGLTGGLALSMCPICNHVYRIIE